MRSIVHVHLGQRSKLTREVLSRVSSGRLPVLFSMLRYVRGEPQVGLTAPRAIAAAAKPIRPPFRACGW
jgi:hypothetical protein